ncbi:hypothetical protein FQA39_LY04803 [Lamprigera yunnana]|nr:hypothetical protein FQA39_LY04803 [Lamprigera yunnana]
MNKSPLLHSEFTVEKRKLIYWLSQLNENENHLNQISVDTIDLSVLLQIMGYRFDSIEKINDVPETAIGLSQIELLCTTSGLRSKFIKQPIVCRCPNGEEVDEAQFWCITGSEPKSASQNSVHLSTNSITPVLSKGKMEIISCLMDKIFSIIGENESSKKDSSTNLCQTTVLTRYRSLDTLNPKVLSNSFKKSPQREPSWEVDPKTSPPTTTSSPLPDITHSVSQITLDTKISDHIEDIAAIKKMVDEKWEKLQGVVRREKVKKRVSDIKRPNDSPRGTVTIQKTPQKVIVSGIKKTRIATPSFHINKRGHTPNSLPKTTKTHILRAKAALTLKSSSNESSQEVLPKSKPCVTSKIKPSVIKVSNIAQPSTSGIARFKKKM